MKLVLGVGKRTYGDDWITVDRVESCNPDVVHDLETGSLPFDNCSFEKVKARHVLEHVDKEIFLELLKEIHRVLEFGGVLEVTGPHHNSWNTATLDHRMGFGQNFFDVVDPRHDYASSMPDLFKVEEVNYKLLDHGFVNLMLRLFERKTVARFFPNTVQEISFRLRKYEEVEKIVL